MKEWKDVERAASASDVKDKIRRFERAPSPAALAETIEGLAAADIVRATLHRIPAAREYASAIAAWHEAAAEAWRVPEETFVGDESPAALVEDLMFVGYGHAAPDPSDALGLRTQADPSTAAPIVRGQRRYIARAKIGSKKMGAEDRSAFAQMLAETMAQRAIEWRRVAAEGAAS